MIFWLWYTFLFYFSCDICNIYSFYQILEIYNLGKTNRLKPKESFKKFWTRRCKINYIKLILSWNGSSNSQSNCLNILTVKGGYTGSSAHIMVNISFQFDFCVILSQVKMLHSSFEFVQTNQNAIITYWHEKRVRQFKHIKTIGVDVKSKNHVTLAFISKGHNDSDSKSNFVRVVSILYGKNIAIEANSSNSSKRDTNNSLINRDILQ